MIINPRNIIDLIIFVCQTDIGEKREERYLQGCPQRLLRIIFSIFLQYKMKIIAILLNLIALVLSYDWTPLENQLRQTIHQGIFTGCSIAIATNATLIYQKPFGTQTPTFGLYSFPVTNHTQFDVGFLTQVIGTNSALMDLIDIKKLHSNHRIGSYLPAFDQLQKFEIRVEDLLLHNSGVSATLSKPFPDKQIDLMKDINDQKLAYSPGSKTVYSQLNYVLLGQIAEKAGGKPIPEIIQFVLDYLDMNSTTYLPTALDNVMPGGFRETILRGRPFNRIADILGTAGNAGMFSTAGDIAKYMQMMLSKGKVPGKKALLFSLEVIEEFLTVKKFKSYKNTRAFGWQTVPDSNPPCGSKFSASPNSFGFSDSSVSYVWADKLKNIVIVFLANGNYPFNGMTDEAISRFQGNLSDLIMSTLGY